MKIKVMENIFRELIMDDQPKLHISTQPGTIEPRSAARALGELLRETPEFMALLKILDAVNNDPAIQQLAAQMRAHRSALQWGQGDGAQHAAELKRLEQELEDLPLIRAYRRAEVEVAQRFRLVNEIISQTAGVDFAANARRSGCCG